MQQKGFRLHPATTSHNYLPVAARFARTLPDLPPGSSLDIHIGHDAWCDAVEGVGFCNCSPSVHLDRPSHFGPEHPHMRDSVFVENRKATSTPMS